MAGATVDVAQAAGSGDARSALNTIRSYPGKDRPRELTRIGANLCDYSVERGHCGLRLEKFTAEIGEIFTVMLVGGSGLYVRAVLEEPLEVSTEIFKWADRSNPFSSFRFIYLYDDFSGATLG